MPLHNVVDEADAETPVGVVFTVTDAVVAVIVPHVFDAVRV